MHTNKRYPCPLFDGLQVFFAEGDLAIYSQARMVLEKLWKQEGVFQCQLTAIGLVDIAHVQMDMFRERKIKYLHNYLIFLHKATT